MRALYRLRWGIERVFGHLKRRGFSLETTHMSDPGKIEKLLGVLIMAFMISDGWGREMKAAKSLPAAESRKSLFRLGLDRISQIFGNAKHFRTEIQAL